MERKLKTRMQFQELMKSVVMLWKVPPLERIVEDVLRSNDLSPFDYCYIRVLFSFT